MIDGGTDKKCGSVPSLEFERGKRREREKTAQKLTFRLINHEANTYFDTDEQFDN